MTDNSAGSTSTTDKTQQLLDRANAAFLSKQFETARTTYLGIIQQTPNHYEALYGLAHAAFKLNDYTIALTAINNAIQLIPHNANAYALMGNILVRMGQYDKALTCYKMAAAHGGKGNAFYKAIIQCYCENDGYSAALPRIHTMMNSIPKAKGDGAYSALGIVYRDAGELITAQDAFKHAVTHEHYSATSVYNYINIFPYLDAFDEMKTFLNSLRTHTEVSQNAFFVAGISYLKIAYMKGQIKECLALVAELSKTVIKQEDIEEYTPIIIYWEYLCGLLRLYKYAPPQTRETDPLLYIIGDSHCLSSSLTTVNYHNTAHRCQPILLAGAQARHFLNNDNNPFRQSLSRQLRTIPAGSRVMLMFGEIDCSSDYGIFPYLSTIGQLNEPTLKETVRTIVTGYVSYCMQSAKPYHHTLIFCGVPSCNLPDNNTKMPLHLHAMIRTFFNQELHKQASEHGLEFLDIYALTATTGAAAFIDYWHVTPATFKLACERYVKSAES